MHLIFPLKSLLLRQLRLRSVCRWTATDNRRDPGRSGLVHLVQQKLKVDTDSKYTQPKGKAVYTITSEDEDVPEEEIGDDFNDEKFALFQESINKGLKNSQVLLTFFSVDSYISTSLYHFIE